MKVKIALSGLANSGKNTVAALLMQYLKLSVELIAFADPIKEIAQIMFPAADPICLYGSSNLRNNVIPNAYEDGKPLTYRKLLCDIGTQARKYNPDIWVNNFDDKVKKLSKNVSVIATDARFREEIDYLKQNDYYLIRLYRNASTSTTINHISETGQSQIDDKEFSYILHNNKPLEQLIEEIKKQIMPNIIA